MSLQKYDITKFGFVQYQLKEKLHEKFDQYRNIIHNISNQDGIFYRNLVDSLEKHPNEYYEELIRDLSTDEIKAVYRTFSFICQKYIWCLNKGNQVFTLPKQIGIIWVKSSEYLGINISCSYSSLILYNCKLDPRMDWDKIIDEPEFTGDKTKNIIQILKNIRPIHNITNTDDEANFYIVHMFIELLGARFLQKMLKIDWGNPKNVSAEQMIDFLQSIKNFTTKSQSILIVLRQILTPDTFFNVLRIYLAGFDKENFPNGLKIEDTEYVLTGRGGSGGQSTLFPVLDEIFGVEHDSKDVVKILADFRTYMPEHNRNLITDLKNSNYRIETVTNYIIEHCMNPFKSIYLKYILDESISDLHKFRKAHMSVVHMYVVKMVNKIKKESANGTPSPTNKNNVHGDKGSSGMDIEVDLNNIITSTENRYKIIKYIYKPIIKKLEKFMDNVENKLIILLLILGVIYGIYYYKKYNT